MNPKCRVWDIKNKKMHKVWNIDFRLSENWQIVTILEDITAKPIFLNTKEQAILMFYIGINDIKGKEIYDGDIVELRYKLRPKQAPIIAVVTWLEHKACFRAVRIKNFIANVGNTEKYNVKIIGNIYQNPDYEKIHGFTVWYPLNNKQKVFPKN